MRLTKRFSILILTIFCASAHATSGFSPSSKLFEGDYDGDGRTDLLVRGDTKLVPIHGDPIFFIGIPDGMPDIVLHQLPSGGEFELVVPSAAILSSTWTESDVYADPIDFNQDGVVDLALVGVENLQPGLKDQVVLGGHDNSFAFAKIVSMTDERVAFISQMMAWRLNPQYFQETAPLRIVGTTLPSGGFWAGGSTDPSNIFLVQSLMSACQGSLFAGEVCGVSYVDPPNCIRQVTILDSFGNPVGTDVVDVCAAFSIHVYIYPAISVVLQSDYSVFNQDALEIASEGLNLEPGGAIDLMSRDDADPLMRIFTDLIKQKIEDLFGDEIFGRDEQGIERTGREFVPPNLDVCPSWVGADNNIVHAAYDGDSQWDATDNSFHHYDVTSLGCAVNSPNCLQNLFRDTALDYFSYPSYQMRPKDTAVDGIENRIAYVTAPLLTSFPWAYKIPAGLITQDYKLVPPSLNTATGGELLAIENRTRALHLVYPGTIARSVEETANGVEIFTHGIGENRFLNPVADWNPLGWNMVIGCANDVFGAKAFATLDRVAAEWFEENIANPAATRAVPGGTATVSGAIADRPSPKK